jgi:hypothetical protein
LAADPYHKDAVVMRDERTVIVEPSAVDNIINAPQRMVVILSNWMIGYLDDHSP